MKLFKKKQEEQNFITCFICTMLQINDQFYCYQSIKILFFILNMSQSIFYLHYSDYEYFKNNISQINGNEMMLYLIRPDIIILQYSSDILLFIIPYVIISFLTITKLGIILNLNKSDQRFVGRWINLNRLQIYLANFTSIYQQLLSIILHQPFQNIVVCSINSALYQFINQRQGYLAFIIFTAIIFFILEIEAITHLFICRQSTTLQIIAFEKSNIQSFDILIYGIQLTQIILFGTLPHTEASKYIQATLTLLIGIMQILNQLINQGYIFQYQRYLLHLINTIIIVYSIYTIIDLKNNAIIIWPLLGYLIFYADSNSQLNSLYSIFLDKKVQYHQYLNQLIKFSNNCYQNEILPIQQGLILGQHKIKCQNVTCICKEIVLQVVDSRQANIITEPILKKFLYQRVKNISKWLQRLQDTSFYETVQATLYMRLDFVLLAIKCFNKLIIQSQKDYRVRVISSEKSVSRRTAKKIARPSQIDSQIVELIQKQQKKAFKYDGMSKTIKLSSLNIIKIQYLLKKAQMHLNENFSTNICTPQQITMSNYVYDYLTNEFELSRLTQTVVSLLKLKIELYYYLIQCESGIADRVFSYLLRYFTSLLKLEDVLQQRYDTYQSVKFRQLIIFFYSRVYNSYLKALKFRQINSNQQQKFVFRSQSIDFFSDKIAYILLQLQDDLQNLKIKSYSSNFLKIICRQQSQELQFNDILPEFIKEQHPILVQRFTQHGQARFYRNLSLTFVQQENGLAKQMEQTFDTVTLMSDNRVIFGAVIQDVSDQKAYLLVNVNGQLAGMTYMCLRKLGYSEVEIASISDFYSFYDVEIQQIVPNFYSMINKDMSESKFNNVKMLFIDLTLFSRDFYSNTSISSLSQVGRMWQDSKYTKEYLAHLFIMHRDIFGFAYYIIEIESAYMLDASHQNNGYSMSQYKHTQPVESAAQSAVFDVDSLILSIDEGAAKNVRTFNIQERENYTGYTKQIELEKVYQGMLSPNNSMSHLIDKSANIILSMQRNNSSFQQDFFCQQIARQNPEQSSKEVVSPLKDQQMHQQISESSIGTTKKPQFMKKFQIIDEFYSHCNFAQQQLLVFFIVFTLIIFCIYSILVLSLLSTDLNTKIQEIEMLSFQANIVAPYDRYLGIRAQIYYYNSLLPAKKINQQKLTDIVEPLYAMIGLCYKELKENSYTSLLEADLKYFFKDVYTNTFFMGMTDKIIYSRNLTFREFIHQLLSYQYDFKIIFDKRIPTKGCPCQVFQFSNYFHLQDNLEVMSQEILAFSQNKCTQIISKWISIWIAFIAVCFVLTFFLFYLRTRVLNQYDTVMEIITHVSEQSLLKEIDKQKYLLNNILSSNDFINSYQLQLQTESQQQQIKNDINETTRKTKRKLLAKTSKIKSILFSAIIFGIFLIYSCLVTFSTQSFLNQYQNTADFYKLIADLSFRSGNMFLYREMFMLWGNLTYLNKSDGLRLYNLIDIAQDKILQYVDEAPRINLNTLLVPENFFSYFEQVQNTDVCEFLDEQYSSALTPYCSLAFDGSLQKGMIPALSYISQTIKVQQAINNFTYRAEDIFYEVEGGQVASRVFSHMNNQLQAGIITKTESFNNQNQLLSIFFIIALAILCLYIIWHYYQEIKTHLQLLKLGVLIIPQSDILKNDFFERYLKQMELKLGYRL